MGSLFLELSKQRSLLKMMEERGFTLCQQNGQRTYGGPPPNWGSRPPPSRDCEVFIGRLPRMCFEDELIPLFLTAGELYEFRLMLDFSGTNRGYGYAHYATPAGAAKAIEKLNKYEIRPGHQIGVLKSKNNCRLLFGNISPSLNVDVFNDFIRTVTDQVLNVLMFKSFQQLKATDFSISAEMEEAFLGRVPLNNRNNQFAIVEYENHKAAAVARRVLIPKYGHILAIDWAVPPRERKRFVTLQNNDYHASSIERPLSNLILKESVVAASSKGIAKVRPVPVLIVQPSPLENVPFMPKVFKTVVKFFKYLLSVCLYKSVDQLEIPLFICKEIERKIVDRITNLENCSQAVQLIFNYFSWYNEKKRSIISSEVQTLMEEIKVYADVFVQFVNRRLKFGPSPNSSEDNYYINILPLHLNVLFRIILRSDGEHQVKLSSGIGKGLNWLSSVMEKGDKQTKEFIGEILQLVESEDTASLDKASSLAKSVFLNAITLHTQPHNFSENLFVDVPQTRSNVFEAKSIKAFNGCGLEQLTKENENNNGQNNEQGLIVTKVPMCLQKTLDDDQLRLKINGEQKISFPSLAKGDLVLNSNTYPPVPLLLVQPSILNNVPFMPKIFTNVLIYFKHLIRVCLNANAWQLNIPQVICNEIERKIIDRISNMENCSEGIQLILNYFSWWIEKRPCSINAEVHKLLLEVKLYADSFVSFTWNKALSGYQPNLDVEDYFCNTLPLRLNLLFQIMLIFNADDPMKFLIGITKGLQWLDDLIQNGSCKAKDFIDELIRFVLEPNPYSHERVKILGKGLSSETLNLRGEMISYPETVFPFTMDVNSDKISSTSTSSRSSSVTSSSSSTAKSDTTVIDVLEYQS